MIYLDHAATSPLLPAVLDAMLPWLGVPANPASAHRAGQRAAAAVERARDAVAALVGGRPEGVVFTSGATEANHLFVHGASGRRSGRRWVASPIEHPCVHDAVRRWAAPLDPLPVGADGRCEIPELPQGLAGLSLMAVNHETGVIQPIAQARRATAAVGAALHVDATQAAGRIPLSLGDVDGVVLSAHKLGGPPGVGALILPDGDEFPPLLGGGGQERGRRAGTVPTALVVGFGQACAIASAQLDARAQHHASLQARLESGLRALGGRVIGAEAPRIGAITLVSFAGLRAELLVQALDLREICASAGSACASGSLRASPVLVAMGHPEPSSGLRLSLGPGATPEAIDTVLAELPAILGSARLAAELECGN